MIDNLNPRTFAAYGMVYDHRAAFDATLCAMDARATHIEAPEGVPDAFWACEGNAVALDFIEGMTVLCVAAPAEEGARAFYLDKPVLLRAGVRFALCAIGQHPGVIRSYLPPDAFLGSAAAPATISSLTLSPSLWVTRLYTFFYQEKPKGFYFGGEKHAPYELVYVDRGVMHCIVGGQRHTLHPQDLLICLPEQWHLQYAEPDVALAFVTVSFDMVCPQAASFGQQVFHAPAKAIGYLEEMLAAQREAGESGAARLPLLLGLLLLALREEAQPPRARYDAIALANENHIVDTALRYIAGNLTRPLTVAAIAAEACVTPSYLAVLFGRHLRHTPLETLHQLKLEEARRLLHQGSMTVTQVSQALGFATLQHFSRLFKAYFGISPRAYARTVR